MTTKLTEEQPSPVSVQEFCDKWLRNDPLAADALVQFAQHQFAVQVSAPTRFFMEHGLWHDRVTGQHMYTQDQYDEESRAAREDGRHDAAQEDAKRLDFMSQHEAWIAWTNDGELCRVFHREEDGDSAPLMGWNNANAWQTSARVAIDAAIAKTK